MSCHAERVRYRKDFKQTDFDQFPPVSCTQFLFFVIIIFGNNSLPAQAPFLNTFRQWRGRYNFFLSLLELQLFSVRNNLPAEGAYSEPREVLSYGSSSIDAFHLILCSNLLSTRHFSLSAMCLALKYKFYRKLHSEVHRENVNWLLTFGQLSCRENTCECTRDSFIKVSLPHIERQPSPQP